MRLEGDRDTMVSRNWSGGTHDGEVIVIPLGMAGTHLQQDSDVEGGGMSDHCSYVPDCHVVALVQRDIRGDHPHRKSVGADPGRNFGSLGRCGVTGHHRVLMHQQEAKIREPCSGDPAEGVVKGELAPRAVHASQLYGHRSLQFQCARAARSMAKASGTPWSGWALPSISRLSAPR